MVLYFLSNLSHDFHTKENISACAEGIRISHGINMFRI